MIQDAASLPSGTVLRSRVCIVGSGMGGSSVAQRLVAAGHDVLLVEAGGITADSKAPDAVAAENVGQPFRMLRTRCIELGGTSSLWHGICTPLDEIDFEPRPWVENSGWPLRRADLSGFYEDAAKLMGVSGPKYWDAQRLEPPVRDRLQDIQFDREILQNKLFEFRKPPLRWKIALQQLAEKKNFRCLVNAPALELIVREDGNTIEHLIVGAGEITATVYADVFIVCAGTLETPRLLLNSRRKLPAGIGNSHGLVGKYLLDHPNGHFCKLGFNGDIKASLYAEMPFPDPKGDVYLVAGLELTAERQRQHRLPNHHLYVRPSRSPARIDDDLLLSFMAARSPRDLTLRQVGAILTHRDIFYRILMTRFGVRPTYRYGDLFFLTEQMPNPRSCVRLSKNRCDRYGYPAAEIDWQLCEADFSAFENFAGLALQGLQSPDYKIARRDAASLWRNYVASAAHHLGTARMATDAAHGVVDADLRVFGIDNLFLCDGSVFPTGGSVNPALTIIALGLRLAAHLEGSHSSLLENSKSANLLAEEFRPAFKR